MNTDRLAVSGLRPALVCPVCKGPLAAAAGAILCASCDARFVQPDARYVNLLPVRVLATDETRWQTRLRRTDGWYREQILEPARAAEMLASEYRPLEPFLSGVGGRILDIGGGAGLARHYVGERTDYVVLDPSVAWLGADWQALAPFFPCLGDPCPFVLGVGECQPFPDASFDAALALWSLNHCMDPEAVFRETHRILAPGGSFVVVLEDVPPQAPDFVDARSLARWGLPASFCGLAPHLVEDLARDWPLQADHIRIREADVASWVSGRFEPIGREWSDRYLVLIFRRLAPGAEAAGVNRVPSRRADTVLRTGTIAADPGRIRLAGPRTVGVTTLSWSADATGLEVRVGAPDGPVFARSGSAGAATTGEWVSDGMVFFLQDVSNGPGLTGADTRAVVRVTAQSENQ